MQNAHKLAVYREARELAIATYRLTAAFPPSERFGLTQQMRRAVVSIGSNIAEGCGRKGSRALLPFLHYAVGSANELTFRLEIATALEHCSSDQSEAIMLSVERTRRMLIRLATVVAARIPKGGRQSPSTHHPRLTTRDSSPTRAPG